VARTLSRAAITSRPRSMWRYHELLPLDGEPTVGRQVGCTPLIRADRLARALGVSELYIKNDAVNYPTLSFKDRVVAVALSKAVELGFQTVGCASTGNLANSVAANAASAGLEAYVLIPNNLEQGKVLGATIYGAKVVAIEGNYDQVNRLCSQIAFRFGWGFVNVNLRPFYAEGSKSMGFEIAEDLGWRTPDHVVAPMAGGSLIGKIHKAFKEFELLGLLETPVTTRMHGAQASGCNPISATVRSGAFKVKPVRNPQTIAKSLAIGDPADGYFASKLIVDTGGWSEDVDDEAIVDAMKLLAETEGIWAETAGGVTLAVAQKLIEQGRIGRDESIVLCITGNGLKTQEPMLERMRKPVVIKPKLEDFEALLETLSPELAGSLA
jgi:threonine synthase